MKSELEIMTIEEIVEFKKGDILRTDPEYQRGQVWTQRQEYLLIDSIMRRYPIPMFYFHHKQGGAGKFSSKMLYTIDGQQRINAICKFCNDEFVVPDPKKTKKSAIPKFLLDKECMWTGKVFSSFSLELQKKFLSTPLFVSIVETENDNEIRDLFVRLQAGLPLSPQEKRDAWPGEFSNFVINTAGKQGLKPGHNFFGKLLYGAGGKKGGVRMRQTCSQIFMTFYTRSVYSNPDAFVALSSQQIDEFYRHNLDFDPQHPDSHAERFREILDVTFALLANWRGPSLKLHVALHTLLLVDALIDDFTDDWKKRFPKSLKEFLKRVQNANSRKDITDEYYREYGYLTTVSSTSKSVIKDRHVFFVSKMVEMLDPLIRHNPIDDLTYAERELLYYSSSCRCKKCGRLVRWKKDANLYELDNKKMNLLEDARLVHEQCHLHGIGSDDEVPWEVEAQARSTKRVTLSNLYAKNLLKDGAIFIYQADGETFSAKFKAPDALVYYIEGEERVNKTPSGALGDLLDRPINGWTSWQVKEMEGSYITQLDDLRKKFVSNYLTDDGNEED